MLVALLDGHLARAWRPAAPAAPHTPLGTKAASARAPPGPPPPLSSLSSPLIPALTSTLHRKRARGSHGFRKVPTGCVLCHPAAGGINWGLGKHILFPECSPGRRQEGGHTLTLAGPWVAGLGVQVEEGAIAGGVGFGQRAGAGPRAGSQAWATAARTGPPWASGTGHQQPQARLPSSAGSGCWGPEQRAPWWRGAEAMQPRVRTWFPPSQETGQSDQGDHRVQAPGTVEGQR